jgi:hypothetical protein
LAASALHPYGWPMEQTNTDSTIESEEWTCLHFSVSKIEGTVPDFLRLIASRLEELGDPEVMDISFSRYWTRKYGELEHETSITVYYHREEKE